MSEVSICNMALGHVGVSKTIAALNEASNEARRCNLYFEPARDAVLADFAWPFAEKFIALADLGTPPTEWLYRYAMPDDCIQPLYIVNPDNAASLTVSNTNQADTYFEFYRRAKREVPYKVSGQDNAGRVILTNEEDAVLCYTQKVTSVNLFGPLFTLALSYKLASLIALPLSVSTDLMQASLQMYQMHISQAWAASLNGQEEMQRPESESVTARLGGGRGY